MKLSLIGCAALFAIATAGAACTSSDARESGPAGPAAFVGDVPADGATVFLRARKGGEVAATASSGATEHLFVDVVARGAPDVHGAALRVTWDPEALAFVEAQSGATWSKQALALAKEGAPGQLAVMWAEKGERGIDATTETVIGTLVFDARGRKGSAVAFKAERSQLVDKKGSAIVVAWRGGAVAPR